MNLNVICQVITDAGLGTLGKTLFQHHMPDACVQGIMLKEPLQGTSINHYIPGFFKGPLMIIVRSNTQANGDALANALMTALSIYGTVYNDANGNFLMKINFMRPRTLPIVYPRTPGNTIEWSITFDACYVLPVSFI